MKGRWGKIGYTNRAGRCLVSSATRAGTQLISVVLNDRNWFEDCYKLMNYGFDNFNTYVIFDKGQYFNKIPINNGIKDYIPVVVKESFIPSKRKRIRKIKLYINLPNVVEAPIKKVIL